jgi:RHS repeat-associated protein
MAPMPRAFALLLPWLLACAVTLVPATAKTASREKFSDTVAASNEIAWQATDASKEDCFDYDGFASGDSLYNYFRDYDPVTGRYRQSDPLELLSGDLSTYAYVNSSALGYFDDLGLKRTQLGENRTRGNRYRDAVFRKTEQQCANSGSQTASTASIGPIMLMFGRHRVNEVYTPRRTEVNRDVYVERPALEKELRRAIEGSQLSFPLFFVCQASGLMPPVLARAES